MCYTPIVSLLTAFIEFILVLVIIIFFKKTFFRNSAAVFISLLAVYQTTEFMLCTSQNPALWALIGFLAYTFLPAIAFHFTLRFVNKKMNVLPLYLFPTLFVIVALTTNFITEATCDEPFVTVKHLFFQTNNLFWPIIYWIYYFGFIISAFLLALQAYKTEKNKTKKKICLLEMVGISIMTAPTFILILLFPILSIKFPSIYCHFALLLAIMIFAGVYLENKRR